MQLVNCVCDVLCNWVENRHVPGTVGCVTRDFCHFTCRDTYSYSPTLLLPYSLTLLLSHSLTLLLSYSKRVRLTYSVRAQLVVQQTCETRETLQQNRLLTLLLTVLLINSILASSKSTASEPRT